MIFCIDSLEFLRKQEDYSFDINYSDPPYALGSEVIIRPDGKVDYKKANDFMNKWEMPTGEYWEQWFKEAYRTLKYGGYCIMFGMDRQLLLFKYYACLAGFTERQSLYWYYISNFPKATDLGKMLDKNAGAEREVKSVKERKGNPINTNVLGNERPWMKEQIEKYGSLVDIETTPSTDLAKKYDGYKYSISPLKQTNETILVFQKPYKSGSCLHDTLAYERGDTTCCCGALDIDGNRVPSETPISIHNAPKGTFAGGEPDRGSDTESYREQNGRYPSQTFCGGTNLTIMVLDDTIDLETKNEIRSCYDELYLQSLREKVLSIAVKSEEWQGEVLHKGLLLSGSESDNERKKSPKLWKKENTRNDSEAEKDLGIEGQEQRTFSELEGWNIKVEGLHSGRLSELPEELLENIRTDDNERQQKNNATQNCDGNTLEQSVNEAGNSSSQKRSETRQQNRELGNIQSTKSLTFTQRSSGEVERTDITNRTFTERDTFIEKDFIPEKWLKHFTYACDILVSTAEVLDKQSGVSKGTGKINYASNTSRKGLTKDNPVFNTQNSGIDTTKSTGLDNYGDTGGCSKILHKCDFEKDEHDLYFYNPKVSKSERNAGCDAFQEVNYAMGGGANGVIKKGLDKYDKSQTIGLQKIHKVRNNHPTLKPIKLNKNILSLFKTPNEQSIIYPFAGSGSEVIGGIKAGFTSYIGCEINQEYIDIANARIEFWKDFEGVELPETQEIAEGQISIWEI